MTTLVQVNDDILSPALRLLPGKMDTLAARRMLLAIGLQESGFATMVQYGNGPARSYWQFERGGGVAGVLRHPSSKDIAEAVCRQRNVPANSLAVWKAMETDAQLGACFARLLLYTDPMPIPIGASEGWACYLRNWRPGKPHPDKWPSCWTAANIALGLA